MGTQVNHPHTARLRFACETCGAEVVSFGAALSSRCHDCLSAECFKHEAAGRLAEPPPDDAPPPLDREWR